VLDGGADDLHAAVGILIAALGGIAVGTERQWSGHATGPRAHLGGIRTFALLGGFAGTAGWLSRTGFAWEAVAMLAGAGALVVASYVAASRREVDATTEVAAFVVLAAGVLAGRGEFTLASGIVAVTCLLLVEKSRLHALVAAIDDVSIRSGARFAVMAVVVLPLLPPGPYGPLGGVRPRSLWMLVLVFAGISFAGYVARRAIGPRHGYAAAGVLGGLVSSTSVTLTFARESRERPGAARPLALGTLAACTVMYARMFVATALLAPAACWTLLPALLVPFATGTGLALLLDRAAPDRSAAPDGPRHPLALLTALQMAIVFQTVLFAVTFVRERFGALGLLASGAFLGSTDVDALVVAMASSIAAGVDGALAARAMVVGALANTLVKLAIVLAVGGEGFRGLAAMRLIALAVATTAGLALA
jgi:uncharacterized membrane protein (DUF4010 family)